MCMARRAAVVVAILWCSSLGACEAVIKNNTISQLQSNSSYLLFQLVRDFIQNSSGNGCTANILSGGYISFKNETRNSNQVHTANKPNLFVTCKDKSGRGNSAVLKDFAAQITSLQVVNDSKQFLKKDEFKNGIIMVAFSTCGLCVGIWMMYMVLLFQRYPQHSGRRALVLFYVLFAAIYESFILNRAIEKIFKKQYYGNYQDAMEYERVIVHSNSYRAKEVVVDSLACLNWISIVYYMFWNCKRIDRRWLPRVIATRNRLIIIIGLCLTIILEAVLGVLLWSCWNNGLRITHFILDLITYTIFYGLMCYFVYHDFGFILSAKKRNLDQRTRAKEAWKILWRDYHQTIPLLVYNLALFGLFLLARIFLFVTVDATRTWKYSILKLFKIAVTASVWGLIAVLEKRELIVSRETVLGRKIQNSDRFFYDPELIEVKTNSEFSHDSQSSDADESGFTNQEKITATSKLPHWALLKFKLPTKSWQSPLRHARSHTMDIETKQKRFRHALAGSNTHRQENEQSSGASRSIALTDEQSSLGDDTSVETELATNYIYDIHDC